MKIHFPFVYPPISWGDVIYLINIRFLFWHFQILEETRKRGYWICLKFNKTQLWLFLIALRYKKQYWTAFKNHQ